MKKIFALMLMLAMIVTPVFAEGLDLAGMGFEELTELKQAVDNEYFARPESEPKVLQPGLYTVGEDIAAGSYQVIVADFGSKEYAWLYLFENQEAYNDRDALTYTAISLYDSETGGISLENGNILMIDALPCAFSVSDFSNEDFPVYEVPEGTIIPGGTYTIGDSIPMGMYQIYSGSIRGAEIYGYSDLETSRSDERRNECDYEIELIASNPAQGTTQTFEEGTIVVITDDVVMKKQAAFTFD